MAAFVVTVLNVAISLIDLILLPINYLIYRPPWKAIPRVGGQPHELIFSKDCKEVAYKPAYPEPTCNNKDAMVKEKLNTMYKVFEFMVKSYSAKPCLGTRKVIGTRKHLNEEGKVLSKVLMEGRYTWQTYQDVSKRVDDVAHGLHAMGIRATDKVLIYADTCPEWLITALACFKSSVTIVTLYTNLGDDGVIYGINQVQVQVVVTSQGLLPKVLALKEKLPHLKTVIVFVDKIAESKVIYLKQNNVTIIPFEHVESRGAKVATSPLRPPTPEDNAVIMYTSGSTGDPKGVVLTHQNMTASLMSCCIRACNLMGHERHSNEVYLAYLPLAHIFEMTQEIIVLSLGIKVGYSSPNTLTDSSTAIMPGHRGDISVLRPTVMAAVPIILDRIYKSIRSKISQKGKSFEEVFDFCVSYRSWWIKKGFDTPLLNRILFSKIQDTFGGQLKAIISGGAPLAPKVHDYLRTTLDVNLAQGYGLTESCGGISLSTAEDLSVGRVGQPLPGVQIKLIDWVEGGYMVLDQTGHGPRGEIILGGPMIAKGYYQRPQCTEEVFYKDPETGERWLRTGDIGQIDTYDAVLRIVDRKKDLVKLQMGEYLSLGKVESCMRTNAVVENICVVADSNRTYSVALVVPNVGRITELAMKLEICQGFEDLCQNEIMIETVTGILTSHGQNELQKFELPRRYALIAQPWTPETGLVTAAMKLKRKVIHKEFESVIKLLYSLDPLPSPALSSGGSKAKMA